MTIAMASGKILQRTGVLDAVKDMRTLMIRQAAVGDRETLGRGVAGTSCAQWDYMASRRTQTK